MIRRQFPEQTFDEGRIRIRVLNREEVEHVWSIDRTETIRQIYRLRDGRLCLEDALFEMTDWPAGEPEAEGARLLDAFDHGGVFFGAFEEDVLVGVAGLDCRPMGPSRDQLQLKFLHVSHGMRGRGLGRRLFEISVDHARALGARSLYISATSSRRTVDFYMRLGAMLAETPDPTLLELEPEDIHLEYRIPGPE
ncbi:MAG: GNAT family N-acetyltransferase [Phycisphaerales bacterium]|nr:GNAT family N-acetyltransferase [Phycisphaerales bacterium]